MITLLILIGIAIVLGSVFGLAFHITGAILLALFWILKLPAALVLWALGAVCCCTVILIPIGLLLFKAGTGILV